MIPAAVFGAKGRMGRLIKDSSSQDVRIVQSFDKGDEPVLDPQVKVVIDFSLPDAWESLDSLLSTGTASLVSGTTGLQEKHREMLRKWSEKRPVFYSANMSIGIHVLKKLAIQAGHMLGEGFDLELVEFHHDRKIDSPSGTALSILEPFTGTRVHGRKGSAGPRDSREIGVHAVRGGDVAGEHRLYFLGQGERLEIAHSATDRKLFALGALRAVMFISEKEPGLYSMEDMLG